MFSLVCASALTVVAEARRHAGDLQPIVHAHRGHQRGEANGRLPLPYDRLQHREFVGAGERAQARVDQHRAAHARRLVHLGDSGGDQRLRRRLGQQAQERRVGAAARDDAGELAVLVFEVLAARAGIGGCLRHACEFQRLRVDIGEVARGVEHEDRVCRRDRVA